MLESGKTGTSVERLVRRVRSSISRYDVLLAIVPVAFLAALLVGRLAGLPFEAALLGGVSIATLALIDGLFLRPPTGLRGA